MSTNFAVGTGPIELLGSMARSDEIPTARMGIYAAVGGVYAPCITTRQIASGSARGFAFAAGDGTGFFPLSHRRKWPNPASTTIHEEWVRSGFSTWAPLEVVIVSQGDQYDGTTLVRGDYRLVCVPMIALPNGNEIYMDPWLFDSEYTPADPGPPFVHEPASLIGSSQAVFLSSVVQDAHAAEVGWQDVMQTIVPVSNDPAIAAALRDLQARAASWSYRRGPYGAGPKDTFVIRTYVQANAPYVSGGAGASINILGAYVRAVIP